MSTVIENQVVQMSFDNKEFEKNISASMKSLDQFKDEMEFKDSERSFRDLEKASESVDFEKLNKAIDGVGDHFTLVGRVFYKVTDEIADYFTSKITSAVNAVKSVTTDIIDPKMGYAKYDEYTHGVKTILAALSDQELAKLEANGESAIDAVEAKLSELMLYTDETSYNFTDMVGTIGKFLGAGIGLDSAVADMQGIANWAALSGQNAVTASQAMYQMSQALGAGYVKYQDWAQMANLKSMGTTAAKDTFIQAAKEIGTITDEEIAEARKALGGEAATDAQIRNWFFEADQLNKESARWFTTEVLEAGLKKFSAVSDEVIALSNEVDITVTDFLRSGKRMKKGTSDLETEMAKFANSGKYTEDELQRIEEVMKRVTSEEYKLGWNALIAAQEAVTFSEAIDATKDAVGTAWMMIFKDLIGNYEEAAELWTDLANNLYDVFAQPLRDAEEEISKWAKVPVKAFNEMGEEIEITMREHMWQGLSRIFGGFGEIFSNLFTPLTEWGVLPTLENVLTGIVNTFHGFADILEDIATSRTILSLSNLLANLARLFGTIVNSIKKVVSAFFGLSGATSSADWALSEVIWIINDFILILTNAIEWLVGSKGFTWALELASRIAGIFFGAVRLVASVFSSLADIVVTVVDAFLGFNTLDMDATMWNLAGAINNFIGRVGKFFGMSMKNISALQHSVMAGCMSLVQYLQYPKESLIELGKILLDFIKNLPTNIVNALNFIGKGFLNLSKNIVKLIGDFFGFDTTSILKKMDDIAASVSTFFKKVGARFQKAFNVICNEIFGELPKAFSEMVDKFEGGTVPDKIEAVLSFIGGCIKRGVGAIIEAVGELVGVDLTGFKDKVIGFLEAFTDQMAKLNPGWETVWDTICNIFWGLVDIFKALADALFYIIGEVTGIENMGPDKILDLIIWILEKMVNVVVFLATGLGTVVEAVGPALIGTLGFLKDIFGQLWSALMYIIGVDKSPEALKALENIRSVVKTLIWIFIALEVWKFFKAVRWMMEGFADLSDAFTGRSFKGVLRSVTNMVRNIALVLFAIGILANQDIGGIAMAVTAMGVVMSIITAGLKKITKELVNLSKAMSKKSISDKDMVAAMKTVSKIMGKLALLSIVITVCLTIMAKATKKYGPDTMGIAVAALGAMLVIMLTGVSVITKIASKAGASDKKLAKVNTMLAKITLSITIISLALNRVIKQITESIKENGDDTAVLDAIMLLCISIFGLVAGTGIIIVAANKIDTKKLGKVSGVVALAAMVIAGLALMISKLANEIGKKNAETLPERAIMALVVSVVLIGAAILIMRVAMSDGLPKKAQKVADSLMKCVAAVARIAITTQAVLAMVLGMLGTFYLIYLTIDKMDLEGILQSFAITVGLFLAAGLLVAFLSNVKIEADWKNMLSYAGALVGIALALLILSKAIGIIAVATMALEATGGVGTLLLVLGILGVILIAVEAISSFIPDNTGLLQLSVAILSMAGALMIFALAITLLALVPGDKVKELAIGIALAFGILMVALLMLVSVVSLLPGAEKVLNSISNAVLKFAIAVAILVVVIMALTLIDNIAEDLTNSLYALNEKLPELVEALVVVIATLLNSLADSLLDHAEEIGEGLYKLLLAIVGVAVELLTRIIENGIKPVLELAGEFWAGVWQDICDGFQSVLDFFIGIGKGIADFFVGLWNWILDFFGIASPSKKFIDLGLNIVMGLWEGIQETAKMVWEFIKNLFIGLWDLICSVFDTVKDFFSGIIDDVWQGIKDGVATVRDWIKNKIETIWNVIKAPFAKAFSLGKDIVEGLWNGINSVVDWIVDKITGFCDKALGAIKKFFGISSPSKVMAEIGGFLMEGLGNGIDSGEGGVMDTIGTVVGDVVSGFLPVSNIPLGFDTSSMLNGIPSMEDFSVDNLTVGDIDYSQLTAFDASALGLESTYNMGVSADMLNGVNIPTNFAPTVEDAQLEQISDVNTQNTEEIVSALGEVKDELSKQAEIISKFSIILDTGTLVGELRDPMDKALGNKSRLATGRGI